MKVFLNFSERKNKLQVNQIPNCGKAITKLWYDNYQAVVQRVPNCGNEHTKLWYGKYQSVVFQRIIPKSHKTIWG